MGDPMPPAAGLELRIVQDIGDGHHRARQQPGCLRFNHGVDLADARQVLFDRAVHLRAKPRARPRPRQEGLVLQQIVSSNPLQQTRQPRAGTHDVDETVGAGINAESDLTAGLVRSARRDAAVLRRDQLDRAAVAATDLAAVDRDIDPIAGLPVRLSAAQGEHDRERGRRAGVIVGVVACHFDRFTVGSAGRVQWTADCLQRQLRAAVVAVRPRLTERRDRAHDELGVDRVQDVPAPAGCVWLARPQVLHHDVHQLRQAPYRGRAVVGERVEHDRLLVGVQVQEEARSLRVRLMVGEGAEAA